MFYHLRCPKIQFIIFIDYHRRRCWRSGQAVEVLAESSFVLQESGKLFLQPYMEQLPCLFVSYFKSILKVGYEIPRLEYYMSHGEYHHSIPPFNFNSHLQF